MFTLMTSFFSFFSSFIEVRYVFIEEIVQASPGNLLNLGALQLVDALCMLLPSHDAPRPLFACSKLAPVHNTEKPLWPLIHTSSHKKPCFLLDV